MVLRRRHRNLIAIARTNAFHLICPKPGRPPRRPRSRSPPVLAKFKSNLKLRPAFFGTFFSASTRKPPLSGQGVRRRCNWRKSGVAKPVGGAFPLRDVVGDHAGGLHRGVAELGIAGNLALDALAFCMQ